MPQSPAPELTINGVPTDLEDAYRRLYPRLLAFFRRLAGEDHAGDLAQDTMVKALFKPRNFHSMPHLERFVFKVAFNHWRDMRRGAPRLVELPDESQLTEPGSALEEVIEEERLESLREAIEGLPAGMRRVITLRLQGKSAHEVATLLRLSKRTVEAHLYAAKKRLHDHLARPGTSL